MSRSSNVMNGNKQATEQTILSYRSEIPECLWPEYWHAGILIACEFFRLEFIPMLPFETGRGAINRE